MLRHVRSLGPTQVRSLCGIRSLSLNVDPNEQRKFAAAASSWYVEINCASIAGTSDTQVLALLPFLAHNLGGTPPVPLVQGSCMHSTPSE